MINKTKSCFEKMNKIGKPLARPKREIQIKSEIKKQTLQSTLQKFKGSLEQLYANKLENLE